MQLDFFPQALKDLECMGECPKTFPEVPTGSSSGFLAGTDHGLIFGGGHRMEVTSERVSTDVRLQVTATAKVDDEAWNKFVLFVFF
jgi:hypothetical protein